MAETGVKRSLATARRDATDFRELLSGSSVAWEVCGSVRRRVGLVSDVDHVVIPRYRERPGGGLFGGGVERVNVLWERLDLLVERGPNDRDEDEFGKTEADYGLAVSKAVKDTAAGPRTCWGERQRSVFFRGHVHELYVASMETWGIVQLIRTGPAAFSRFVVMELTKHGYRASGGRVERRVGGDYGGTTEASWEPVAVPTERDVFDLIGLKYREPRAREGRW